MGDGLLSVGAVPAFLAVFLTVFLVVCLTVLWGLVPLLLVVGLPLLFFLLLLGKRVLFFWDLDIVSIDDYLTAEDSI